MIGLLRWTFAQIDEWVENLIQPAPQVQYGVAGAADEQEEREVNDLIASFGFPAEFSLPVAADAAGTGPGAPATPTTPAPGHPDRISQVDSVTALLIRHRISVAGLGSLDPLRCHGCFWSGDDVDDHRAHQARLVVDMLRADARMAAATNKFQQ